MTVQEVLKIAKAELGVKENPANSNNVKYNTWYYGHSVQDGTPKGVTYPWCAVFISWLFKDNRALCPKTASCLNMLEWFEKNGQIVKDPKSGDIVFFKYKTNKRRTNHVGIVVATNGKVINTIEGNTSVQSQDNGGCVMQRNRHSNIVAYARPRYSDDPIKKSVDEVAREIISKNNPWGNGAVRRQRLAQAGYDYKEVQDRVNKLLIGEA